MTVEYFYLAIFGISAVDNTLTAVSIDRFIELTPTRVQSSRDYLKEKDTTAKLFEFSRLDLIIL